MVSSKAESDVVVGVRRISFNFQQAGRESEGEDFATRWSEWTWDGFAPTYNQLKNSR